MKKHIRIILIFLISVSTLWLTSCFNDSKEADSIKEDQVQLNFRITWDKYSGRGESIANIVNLYNQSQDDIYVNLYSGNEDEDDFLYEINQDIIDVYAIPYRFVHNKDIHPELYQFTDQFDSELENYYDTFIRIIQNENKIKGIPWIGHSMGLVFNKDITTKSGVDPYEFKSMDDLLFACKEIEQNTDASGIGLVGANHHDISWMVTQFIYSYGGELECYDNFNGEYSVAINSPQSAEALDFYFNNLSQYAQDDWENASGVEILEAFLNRDIAFEIQGPWAISDVWKKASDMEIGAIPLSQIGMYSEVGPILLSISKDSEHIEEAISFIRFMIEVETLEIIMEGEYDEKYDAYYPYRVPLRKDMEELDFFQKYPEFLVFIEGYKMPSINTPCEEWEAERKDKYTYYLHEIAIGNISIEDALLKIEE